MKIDEISVSAYTVPTDAPESNGTLAGTETTMVLVEACAGDEVGLGYSYADVSTALLIRETLVRLVIGLDPMDTPSAWQSMVRHVRNLGRTGIAAMG
jgi:L-alanine-DL-glutamate epimerase-like enolase superfamily enzyme